METVKLNSIILSAVVCMLINIETTLAQRVGIDTIQPEATLHVGGEDGLLVTGDFGQGADLETSGAGTKLFFYPKKAAFRAGRVLSNRWDDAQIGDYSFAWGYQTEASGPSSTAWGVFSKAGGIGSTAWGAFTLASGRESTAWGDETEASGKFSTAWGLNTEAIGDQSTAWGNNVKARSFNETVIGQFNTFYVPNSTTFWDPNDRLFSIGNGTQNMFFTNDAMVVLKNGNTGIGISNPQHKLAVEVTTNTTPNGDGIGLVNTDNNNYWNIHMSNSFLRFSYNNATATAYIESDGTYVQPSDLRLKENIQPLQDGVLQKVNSINTVHYNYKNDKEKNTTTGVIAQELKEIFPEFVHQDEENDYMGVNYAGLSVVAIKALQEQQTEIEELKAKINTQNKNLEEIEELKAKNKALEDKVNQILQKLNDE